MNHNQAKKILGVEPSATAEDIKKAYRKLAMKHHPDRNQGDKQSEEEFKNIKAAFDVLQQPEEDNIVYRYANSGQHFQEGAVYTSIHNVVFSVTIKEAFAGITKMITLPGALGAIPISVPAGVGEEDCVKIVEFEKSIYRVYVKISDPGALIDWGRFEPHKRGDLTIARAVCPFTMMIGGFHKVTTIDGSSVQVRIPRGLEANKLLKVRGKGYWKNKKCLERGDLFIRVVPAIQKIEDIELSAIKKFLDELDVVTAAKKND